MPFSIYAANKLLDHVFGASVWTPPATLYCALFTTAPSGGGGGVEPSTGGYARVAVTNNGTNFAAASAGVKRNATLITFGTASADVGDIAGVGWYDASSGGNLIAYGEYDAARSWLNGQAFNISVNYMSMTFGPAAQGLISTYLANKLLDLLFGATSYSPPSTLYAKLYTAAPTAAGGGTEATGGGYARQGLTNNATNFPAADAEVKQEATLLDWGTASANVGTLIGAGWMDASSGGNLLLYWPFSVPRDWQSGEPFSISAYGGSFTIA